MYAEHGAAEAIRRTRRVVGVDDGAHLFNNSSKRHLGVLFFFLVFSTEVLELNLSKTQYKIKKRQWHSNTTR